MIDRDSARAAKQHLRTRLADLDGVGGVGIGRRDGSYVVTVDVLEETVCERVPTTWEGVTVEVRVVGRVTPLAAPAVDRAHDTHPAEGVPGPGPRGRS